MSLRLEMLQVARLAPKLLGESAELVRDFLLRQQNPDGGFRDRAGQSDLYYTVFGIDGFLALQAELPVARIANYLRGFGEGESLDFVHLCCLARGWGALRSLARGYTPGVPGISESEPAAPPGLRRKILCRIESFRSKDGGYHPTPGSEFGTAYGCFLALGAYQDLQTELPEPLRLVQCLKFL